MFLHEGCVVCSKVEPKIGISKRRGRNLSFSDMEMDLIDLSPWERKL
jgi:hypothetical protein